MSGFLFVVPPLVGHINPAVGVADLLLARGHRVAWACADPGLVGRLAGDRAPVFPCAGPVPGVGEARRPPDLRGPEALKFLWEWYLLPLAEAMAPGVRAAVETFRPDVVVADQQAFSGGLVAERAGLPWATSATTSAEFADPLAGLPKVTEWLAERLAGLRGSVGVPAGDTDPRFSPHLVLAFSTVELAGPPAAARAARSAGSALDHGQTARGRLPLGLARPRPGHGAGDPRHRERGCRRALPRRLPRGPARTGRPGAGVVVDPGNTLGADAASSRGDIPSPDGTGAPNGTRAPYGAQPSPGHDKDLLVLPSVPQLALLERVDAVVCHAGHNTVCEALWHGVPLVVAPIRDDQPVVAGQVVDAGAGVRVRFGRVTVAKLGAALDAVLHEPGHRAAAERIGTAFRAAGGATAAADSLEQLAWEYR